MAPCLKDWSAPTCFSATETQSLPLLYIRALTNWKHQGPTTDHFPSDYCALLPEGNHAWWIHLHIWLIQQFVQSHELSRKRKDPNPVGCIILYLGSRPRARAHVQFTKEGYHHSFANILCNTRVSDSPRPEVQFWRLQNRISNFINNCIIISS